MGYFARFSLKVSDKSRTKAAELTLRQSIFPLVLVTSLFFLWVNLLHCSDQCWKIELRDY
jgi:hypothetical protein